MFPFRRPKIPDRTFAGEAPWVKKRPPASPASEQIKPSAEVAARLAQAISKGSDAEAEPEPPRDKREDAKALLAMLSQPNTARTGASPALPPSRLRELARDLVAQVENPKADPERAKAAEAVRAERRARALERAQSAATTAATPGAPAATRPGPARRGVFTRPKAQLTLDTPARPDRRARITIAPARFDAVPAPIEAPDGRKLGQVLHPPKDIDRLVKEGYSMGAGQHEHPVVVAMTMLGKPPIRQAAELRLMPRPEARTVHRALRLLEARGREVSA